MTGNVQGLAKEKLEYTLERQKADFNEEKGIMINARPPHPVNL